MGLVEKLHCAFNNVDTSLTSTENRENRLRRASGLVHAKAASSLVSCETKASIASSGGADIDATGVRQCTPAGEC